MGQANLRAIHEWLTHPRIATILPDLTAEAVRNPALANAIETTIGRPRRAFGAATLQRAIDRGELSGEVNIELALDLIAAPVYWRLGVRHVAIDPGYLDDLAEHLLRALRSRTG
ncbi:hypothetical protein JOF56_010475 [Kibdelosporangium banguiense]|uniref:Tetracyclin repressor-like C-terminal domain-containing protein n=1 Tax=Kibdelosporangium banguiense TaxID=1365924 RepID=A0ABS4U0B0_9PSEU|nr:TetR-like C-terminal domain-containing protein [Kibdelosporangium banguiense]MBP2330090.1 hypothetical protein [Kibdelosporangium banguiense]